MTLFRGLGRSYGDASIPAAASSAVGCTRLADRLLAFDPDTGFLHAEAGITLEDLNACLWPRGFTVPVTPGTQYVTLGGMVASDVHGKNHHVRGTFGEHVRNLRIQTAEGHVIRASDECERDLFRATLGGMGLTGHVLDLEFTAERIAAPWLVTESEQVADLDTLITGLRAASAEWPMTVAWVDSVATGSTTGRGIVMKGRWARADEAPARPPRRPRPWGVPFDLPDRTLSRTSVGLFNSAYFHRHGARRRQGVSDPFAFFYPLDAVRAWNRIYGRRGLAQYQCVVPYDDDGAAVHALFAELARSPLASFLSVVKDCGPEGKGMLSFPRPGVSVALDVPIVAGVSRELVAALNAVVIAAGGRIYLAKDALTTDAEFARMEPRLGAWNAVRRRWDPQNRIRSGLSVRLLGDVA